MDITALLIRTFENEKQSLGYLYLYDYKGIEILKLATLELPDLCNQKRVSRINESCYNVVTRWSKKYGYHFHVLDVDGRTLILIHFGNYYTQTKGCILVGNNHKHDINKDGYRDVTSSRKALSRLVNIAPNGFKLNVINGTGNL